ncbi:TolC family outer membrane protein [Bordetella sp. BOR01]|uniref:TolC family outer membrane protein n=1 Tax=Bordetella sp. BOR01 TaxID=2854779 RepID=UPI001C452DD5|nr:TolC family outer membrane protein [Bordetella sp. BOR01]MBV7484458.1 TolC family outer membrane protein [Bordetella sp. BOR01]
MRAGSLAGTLVLALAACLGAPAQAAEDLLQVWRLALAKDPLYAAARASYRASIEQLPQARADLLPAVNAEVGGAYEETRATRNISTRRRDGTRGTWDLILTQPLYDWSRWQRYEQAKLGVADAELQLQQAYQDLLLRVSDAYFNVLAAQDTLTATEGEKAAVGAQLEAAKRNFELGNSTITDTYEAQARYDLVVAQELLQQNALDVLRDQLAQIIGQPSGALAELPGSVPLPPPQPARQNDWSTQAEAASLTVARAQLQTQIAQRDIQVARSGHYPTLSLRASSGNAIGANRDVAGSRAVDSSVGLVLSVPIYSGGGVSSQVTEKVQLEQKARNDYEAARRQAVQLARQYYTGVVAGLARIAALEAGEKSSRAAVQANQTGYEIGVRINLDVLNAQQQLYATQRDLAQARYRTLLDGLRLKATGGILSEADLEAVNRLLRLPN